MNIKFKKLHPSFILPKKATTHAVCYDVIAVEIELDQSTATIKLGFATEMPVGIKGVIVPRSSFCHKGWVMQNSPAQIDSDYRGEWMIKFEAIPAVINKGVLYYSIFPYKVGDRVAQIYFTKEEIFNFKEVDKLSSIERGDGGFGHTDHIVQAQ